METSPVLSKAKERKAGFDEAATPILAKFDTLNLRFQMAVMVRDLRGWVRAYRSDTPLRDQALTGTVLLFGMFVAGVGYLMLDNYARSEAQREFAGPAVQFSDLLKDTVDRHAAVLDGLGTLFSDEGAKVDRWRFFEQAQTALPEHSGIESVQWIPRVPREQRRSFETRAREDGLFDFSIVDTNAVGMQAAAGDRPFYLPVFYVEPFQGQEDLLGRDLTSDPLAMESLAKARDAGMPVASRHARPLGLGDDGIARYDIVVPIYSSSIVPLTVEERRNRLIGFLRGSFRYDALIESVLPGLSGIPGLRVYIFEDVDGAEGRLLYRHGGNAEDMDPTIMTGDVAQGLFTAAGHQIAGWRWTIVVKPVQTFLTRNLTSGSWGFATFVLLLTVLLVFYLVSSQTRTRAIERSVAQRTAELESEITERKRIENELRAAKEQAESANRAKSEFLAMMSHELRTPLNAVIGFAEVMSREYFGALGNEQYRRYSEDIHASGLHLLSLINDILDLSKIEAKRYELHHEDFSLSEVWQAVKSMMQENIANTELELVDRMPEALPLLHADARAFRQILLNLLSNAVKFTPDGGQVSVRAAIDHARCLTIEVADTGIGISPADVDKVLQPFKQVDSSLARKYEGTGLGLPLTKRLVEMHGGTLVLESSLGAGTTVTLSFGSDILVADLAEPRPPVRADEAPEDDRSADPGPGEPVWGASAGFAVQKTA